MKEGIVCSYKYLLHNGLYITCWFEVALLVDLFYNNSISRETKTHWKAGQRETYKLTLKWYTFRMVNASAKQWTNIHVLLLLHLVYLQIPQTYCNSLEENYLYSNKKDMGQTSMLRKRKHWFKNDWFLLSLRQASMRVFCQRLDISNRSQRNLLLGLLGVPTGSMPI